MSYFVYLRHTEHGVQVGKERTRFSRIINIDPNAEIIKYDCDDQHARDACDTAIKTLRFTNRLLEKEEDDDSD